MIVLDSPALILINFSAIIPLLRFLSAPSREWTTQETWANAELKPCDSQWVHVKSWSMPEAGVRTEHTLISVFKLWHSSRRAPCFAAKHRVGRCQNIGNQHPEEEESRLEQTVS